MLPIDLDHASGVPIYVQLKEAIRDAVRAGAYSQGTRLPTVRQLAVQLRINANTVSRAYADLEREGVISSQQGRGTFVTLPQGIDRSGLKRLEQGAEELVAAAEELGLGLDDVIAVLENIRRKRSAKERCSDG